MISVTFYKRNNNFLGFKMSGHSDYAEKGYDIVCSAVSSAAFLTANNITDFFSIKADVTLSDGYMKLTAEPSDNLHRILDGFYQHMLGLEGQYNQDINVKISEV